MNNKQWKEKINPKKYLITMKNYQNIPIIE